jgi:hypothetical protein
LPLYRLEGLDDQVLQWCVCRLEAWFAADADEISLKNWDQVRAMHWSKVKANQLVKIFLFPAFFL